MEKTIKIFLLIILLSGLSGCIGYWDHTEKMIDIKTDAKLDLSDAVVNTDVNFILGQLSMYYAENSKYPESLSELSDFSGTIIKTKDPLGNDYFYKSTEKDFELCFLINSDTNPKYKKGKNCVNAGGVIN